MLGRSRTTALACWIGLLALASGCQSVGPARLRRPGAAKDPCAERLHDLCGQLLLYYSNYKKLPPTLTDLKSVGAPPGPPWVCPMSGKPYIYDSNSAPIAGGGGRLVLFDAEPSHSGTRWGILVDKASGGANFTARVVVVAETDLHPPRKQAGTVSSPDQ